MRFRRALLCACLAFAACDKKPPSTPLPPATPDPGPGAPTGIERITGNERLGWDQQAGSAEELATFQFLIYVDSVGSQIQSVSCTSTAGPAGFSCSGSLPVMTAGQHTLSLSSYIDSGDARLESPRSPDFSVIVIAQAASSSTATSSTFTTTDGVQLRTAVVGEGLDDPTDLVVAPDGRLFIAERKGRIRIFHDGRLQPAPALVLRDASTVDRQGLLALAVDPRYNQNHFVYAVYTTASGFRLVRVRAVGDTLGDRAILMEAVPSSAARPAASIRFGPDAKLYVGFDDLGQPVRARDRGLFNGKILRLNADATTPVDQAGGSPIYAENVSRPRGLDWDAGGATLWVADGRLEARDRQGAIVARYSMPDGADAADLVFYRGDLIQAFRGNLLVAADGDHALLRVTFDPADPRKIVGAERLLLDAIDEARAVGVSPDGAIYICTTRTLVRLAPERR